ncbi:LlaJI family restriction endonuclease [Vibrio brasiliensis]|uniref:LlaJI restriction endonuclease n=1 Tax=Vibrio brasiliensis LMG 20546 TaxID=945543 RepID=E8LZT8_9VIBR|nr:LlaJI family restriction endonuclease [Vibrio brasiliensis]EGA63764.1 hypothetical protein VIBR0546_08425 [Vibrio brasiliensis LMG 20546]
MELRLELHTDRSSLLLLDTSLRSVLINRGLVTTGGKSVSFCGLVHADGKLHAFLPRSTKANARNRENEITMASQLMEALHRYSTTKNNHITADDDGDEFIGMSRLSSIVWLLRDFRTNGLFFTRKQKKVINSGKPDWKNTISRRTAFLTDNGPVYLDIDGVLNSRFIGDELTRIHAHVIRKLDEQFSWLISPKKSNIADSLQAIPQPSGKTSSQIAHLKSQLHTHYATRDIELISHLLTFLEETRGQSNNSYAMGVKRFEGMWEHMLAHTLKWTIKVNHLLPTPAYKMSDGSIVEAASKGLRTDIVLNRPHSNIFAVVDAKYYDTLTNTRKAPGWPDLVKQFFYAKALHVYRNSARVNNAFIFPGEDGVISSAHMKNRGTGTLEDTDFPPIQCIYVCPNNVIQHYINRKKMVELSELLVPNRVLETT